MYASIMNDLGWKSETLEVEWNKWGGIFKH
jgi:hypothetical protein